MKLAILCSDDAHHKYLVSLLRSMFDVGTVIVESAASQRQRLLRTGRYVDYFYNLYHYLRRRAFGLSRYRKRYFSRSTAPPRDVKCHFCQVHWINEQAVVQMLKETAPDVTVVMGTSILRKPVLEAAGANILNIHGGYLPDYRGNHCIFFAMYDGAWNKLGSTIHFIDPGIDTGDIVEVVVPPLFFFDCPEKVYCRAELMAIERLTYWLRVLERGEMLPRAKQEKRGRLCRTRDRKLRHEFFFWIRWATKNIGQPKSASLIKLMPELGIKERIKS